MDSVALVKAICKQRKIPISKLERDLGYANGYIGQLRKGTFPANRISEIAQYLSVPVEYLMNGTEETKKMPTQTGEHTVDLSDVDYAFYGGYKELDEHDQETIRDMVRLMRERRKDNS